MISTLSRTTLLASLPFSLNLAFYFLVNKSITIFLSHTILLASLPFGLNPAFYYTVMKSLTSFFSITSFFIVMKTITRFLQTHSGILNAFLDYSTRLQA